MKALVIGYGSIGARHARILTELGCQTEVVSERDVDFPIVYADLIAAFSKGHPEYVVVANITSRHHETLSALVELGYAGTVLVEKPVFSQWRESKELPFQKVMVAYNLRFHPIIQRLKTLLDGEKILSAQTYVGQYLPDWRPSRDYRSTYSASVGMGGGVLRDLSHELDYLTWMLGRWEQVSALGGHFSSLEIDSDDVFALMFSTKRCPIATLQLNYLDRLGRRSILINTSAHTIEANLLSGTIAIDADVESVDVERDYTYKVMHQEILFGNDSTSCSLGEGIEILELIEAAEKAAKRGVWVVR